MREFQSFGAFGRHLLATAAIGEEVTHHITEQAAEIIKADAQKRIGEYQEYTGPFNTWAPLAEATVADRVAQGFSPDEPLLRTGELRDSIEAEAKGDKAVVGSTSDIALYQELGTDKIPPRPFLGPAGYDSKLPIGEMAAKTMIAWICGMGWKRPSQLIKLP
jgi:HK97 gp10 family phage protein